MYKLIMYLVFIAIGAGCVALGFTVLYFAAYLLCLQASAFIPLFAFKVYLGASALIGIMFTGDLIFNRNGKD